MCCAFTIAPEYVNKPGVEFISHIVVQCQARAEQMIRSGIPCRREHDGIVFSLNGPHLLRRCDRKSSDEELKAIDETTDDWLQEESDDAFPPLSSTGGQKALIQVEKGLVDPVEEGSYSLHQQAHLLHYWL